MDKSICKGGKRMKAYKKMLSIVFTVVFAFVMVLRVTNVQAADKKTVVPEVSFAISPVNEYTAGDRVKFNINSPNYGGLVEYRVILWDDNKKTYSDLWNEKNGYPNRYYTKWQPWGNTIFTLGWPISEPGNYRITVFAKRVGVESSKAALKGMNCDSYMESAVFTVKPKVMILDKEGQTYGSKDENKGEAFNIDTRITANNVILNNVNINGDLYISGNNAIIKNAAITGKISVDPGEEGNCTLEKVTANSIEVLSGGKDSIHIKDVQADSMNLSSSMPVRIEVDGDTEIISTTATGYVIFDRKSGTYGTIRITQEESGVPVIEFIGEIKDKVVVETEATIKTVGNSKMSKLLANTKMGKVKANKDCEIYLNKTAVIEKLEKGNNTVVIKGEGRVGHETVAPTVSRGTSSGGNGNGNGDGHVPPVIPAIKVSKITVTGTADSSSITTKQGTLQMLTTIEPVNSTNKNITWSLINGTGSAEISQVGLVTAKIDGTVTVKATAMDGSGVFGEKVITISGQAAPQVPEDFSWTRTFIVGLSTQYGYNLSWKINVNTTSDGGYIISGITSNLDIVLLKVRPDGSEEWRKVIGYSDGTFNDFGHSVLQTDDGGYILAGSTMTKRNEADTNVDMLVIKTDSQGNKVWEKLYGEADPIGGPTEVAYSIEGTNDGGYIITGSKFADKGWDVYLVKIDSVGQMQWSNCYNGPNGDEYYPSWESGFDVIQTGDGGYIIAGETTKMQSDQNNIYVVKTNGTGALEWDYSYGGLNGNVAYSVEETAEGYSIGGYCKSNINTWDFCLINLNKAGDQIDFISHGQNHKNYGREMTKTSDGGYIISGTTYADGLNTDRQVYIVKILNGVVQWERTFGGSGFQESNTIEETADGGFIIAGHTYISGKMEIYLIKTDSEGRVLTELDISPIDAAIKAANTARDGVVISFENGTDMKPDTQWVTYEDDQTFSVAIIQASYNKDNVKSVQDVENEVAKLNTAIAVYNSKKAFGTKGTLPVLVNKITVTGYGGETAITTPKGTLQMFASVEPSNAGNMSVTWSIAGVTTAAAISIDGLLTAQSNGSVRVRATANDTSGLYGEMLIAISGQEEPSEIILITTAEELQAINSGLNKNYKLVSDIDLSSLSEGWTPIGDLGKKFTGTFDGDNHKITGLNITLNRTYDVGLFGSIASGGTVKNLGLEAVVIDSVQYNTLGCIAGSNYGTITNSYAKGNIRGVIGVGGLAGTNYGTIESSFAEVGVVGTSGTAGGLAGTNTGTIRGSHATGRVTGYINGSTIQGIYVGGLAGSNALPGIIVDSYATGEVVAQERVGGLVGYNSQAMIDNCSSTGDVQGSKYVGGLVGYSFRGTILNSQARNNNIINNSRSSSEGEGFKRVVGYIDENPTLNSNYAKADMLYSYYVYNETSKAWELVPIYDFFNTDIGPDKMNGADILE
ncbi:MAG: hypothetical protein K0R09_1511 [Clostridiales bacterium]|nr:hypothetical protein [Clostridiales bacterium]